MFASSKPKILDALGAKTSNSRQQFVAALNGSFDTAESLLHKSYNTSKVLKQTTLPYGTSIKRPKFEDRFNTLSAAPHKCAKSEFFLMPMPVPKEATTTPRKMCLNRTIDVVANELHEDCLSDINRKCTSKVDTMNPMLLKLGRTKIALMGRIDFCLKMHKLHPTMDALWDVYGQLKRITNGKQRGENILLLRNLDGGPILQSIYYDFALSGFETGCFLRVVGRFVGENRLHTFKLQMLEKENYMQWIQHFTRIQNVASFVLLQNGE